MYLTRTSEHAALEIGLRGEIKIHGIDAVNESIYNLLKEGRINFEAHQQMLAVARNVNNRLLRKSKKK